MSDADGPTYRELLLGCGRSRDKRLVCPNNMAQRPTEATKGRRLVARSFTYAPTLLYGSLAALDQAAIDSTLKASTGVVLESNRMKAAGETIRFADGGSPIKHVIYILKENRTYDQVFGDLAKDWID